MAMTPQQQAMLQQANDPESGLTPLQRTMLKQVDTGSWGARLRTFGQGASFGWNDEAEALIRSVLPGGREYEVERDELRQKLDQYRKDHPGEAISTEVAGALLPTGLALASGFGAPAAAAKVGRLAQLARVARVGAAEGTVAGAGYSEGETPRRVAEDAAMGTVTGAIAAPLMTAGGQAVGNLAAGLVDTARTAIGNRASTAVQAELQRLAEGTGKTVDEIVADIMEGRIMAENRTLQAAVRAYKSKGGDAGAYVTEQVPLRRGETRQAAQEGLQEGLTPGISTDANVFRAMKNTDDELRDMERAGYKEVFGGVPELDPQTGRAMEHVLQRFPDARTEIERIYSNSERLVPLFDMDPNGALRLTRAPTLEDAEIVRRALNEEASKAYRGGSGTLGEGYADAEKSLRAALDTNYPELAGVRQQAAVRRTMRDQFTEGRRAFNMPADELEVVFEQVKKDPAKLQAFRAGVMDAVRNKMKRQQNITAKMADPERQEGAVLRIVFPEEGAEQMAQRLSIAGDSEEMYNRVMFNSMTAPEQAASKGIGSRGSVEDAARMAQGDPIAIMSGIQRALAAASPGLNDKQRMEVVRALFSEDPDFVRRALTDDTLTRQLVDRFAEKARIMGRGARTGGVQQSADMVGTLRPTENQQE